MNYKFDPTKLRASVEIMSVFIRTFGADTSAPDAFDQIVTDIEELHLRAQQRDHIIDALRELPQSDEVDDLLYIYSDMPTTEDLNL